MERKKKKSQLLSSIDRKDCNEFKKILLELDGDIHFTDDMGLAPLHYACIQGCSWAVNVLLDMGSNVTYRHAASGFTPLHCAALSGNVSVGHTLIEYGADPLAVTAFGHTVFTLARVVGQDDFENGLKHYFPRYALCGLSLVHNYEENVVLPLYLIEKFQNFAIDTNLHPNHIALSLQAANQLVNLDKFREILTYMLKFEIDKEEDANEPLLFKWHYLIWIVCRLMLHQRQAKNFIANFCKETLTSEKLGFLHYLVEIRRQFPIEQRLRKSFFVSMILRIEFAKDKPVLLILRELMNGHECFDNKIRCDNCATENPKKSCSKCKGGHYCNEICQNMHFCVHKNSCVPPTEADIADPQAAKTTSDGGVDTKLADQMAKLSTK